MHGTKNNIPIFKAVDVSVEELSEKPDGKTFNKENDTTGKIVMIVVTRKVLYRKCL